MEWYTGSMGHTIPCIYRRASAVLKLLWFVIFMASVLFHPTYAYADTADAPRKADLEQQIQKLETEANNLDVNLQKIQGESHTLANEVSSLNTEIKQRELQIKKLALVIQQTQLEVKQKSIGITSLTQKIDKNRKGLAAGLLMLSAYDHDTVIDVLLKHQTVSDFFDSLAHLERLEGTLQDSITTFRQDRTSLENQKADLESLEEDQQNLKALQDVERRFLAEKKKEKDDLLRLTKGKEAIFQQLLKSKKQDITTLKTQLFYLEKTGITAEDAVRFADLAAKRAGIRTAFLLALLEVETGKQFEDGQITVGTNLGTGNWQTDLYNCYIRLGKRASAEAEKKAFLQITGSLNLDPNSMPVSRKPNYGCGGAMGPAQFLPTTWLRFSNRVADLTGHTPPNPWSVEGAFTASAVFLAQAGATSQTNAGELAAAKTYISGNPRCTKSICKVYSKRILSLSRDIDQIL